MENPPPVAWSLLSSLHSTVGLLLTFIGVASSPNTTVEWKGACFYENGAWMELHNKSQSRFGCGTLHLKLVLVLASGRIGAKICGLGSFYGELSALVPQQVLPLCAPDDGFVFWRRAIESPQSQNCKPYPFSKILIFPGILIKSCLGFLRKVAREMDSFTGEHLDFLLDEGYRKRMVFLEKDIGRSVVIR